MNANTILFIIVGYFGLLFLIAQLTGKKATNDTFFRANRSSRWFLVAFGMVGASLSGITFISVPGQVLSNAFSYMPMVFGYLVGYALIAFVLLPIYYRLNLTSIYTYLEQRLGFWSYKTGAFFFLLSRTLGASMRLFIVADVLQMAIFSHYGIPFWVAVAVAIALIWVYTYRGGMKTIVLTDTLQTGLMLLAVGVSLYLIKEELGLGIGAFYEQVMAQPQTQMVFTDWASSRHVLKMFLSGAFIATVMTGLDQDMMQKNLTCRNLRASQKNVLSLSIMLIPVNFLFLFLGAALLFYAGTQAIELPGNGDHLFQTVALHHLPPLAGVFFILGISAAAYSSADSALTSLTTSFCYDFLDFDKRSNEARKSRTRKQVHVLFSLLLFLFIMGFWWLNDETILEALFSIAGYTYGPLLGLFAFGLFTKYKLQDKWVPLVALLAPILTYLFQYYHEVLLFGIDLGFAFGLLNGLLCFLGLVSIRRKA